MVGIRVAAEAPNRRDNQNVTLRAAPRAGARTGATGPLDLTGHSEELPMPIVLSLKALTSKCGRSEGSGWRV